MNATHLGGQIVIKVMLVEDHTIVRDGLRQLLSVLEDIKVVEVAATVTQAVAIVNLSEVDVVVSDYSLPDQTGLKLVDELRSKTPPIPVIILSMHCDDDIVMACIEGGAKGYLSKLATQSELSQAIREVAEGGTYLQPSLAFAMLRKTQKVSPKSSGREPLTERESELLHLVVAGGSNQSIADELHLSLSSVKAHMRGLFRKLDAEDRTQAVVQAVRKGYLEAKDLS